ncbi:flagellar hook-length control protein [Collimonas arenae]|uniref:flagellar hook-length control protein n=1 Tax=Collimonas arenae TaxID=279058 RepID=UPI000AB0DEA3|nr:flagellar hook-length control protein [Collimonas arenae]
MSIAVSAMIRPSRMLLFMVGGLCSLVGLSGVLIVAGVVGNLMLVERLVLAFTCLAAALYGLFRYTSASRSVRIDISAAGQIRIADAMPATSGNTPVHVSANAYLLQGTTLWSHLLLLRLRLDSGSVRTIAILPDCVPNDTFRVLSVACRWISMRTDKMEPD